MLKIRAEQLAALQAAAAAQFEMRMETHVREWFPAVCATLPNGGITLRIRDGIARAQGYGFTTESDQCRFVDLTFALGPRFDDDPALPWVRDILAGRAEAPNDTMRFLYAETQRRLAAPPERLPMPS